MIKVLIVEDDPQDAAQLYSHCMRYAKERGIAIEADTTHAALEMLSGKRTYDVIFLDIDLPGITGMEAAQLLRAYDSATRIVFVTNLAQYAIRGYEVGALDFVVKPVTYRNFCLHMNRVLREVGLGRDQPIVVSTRDAMHVIKSSELVAISVRGHTMTYHLDGGDPIVAHGNLSSFEKEHGDSAFVRISASCMVNMNRIKLIQGDTIKMDTGETWKITRAFKQDALATVASFLGGGLG